MWSWLSFALLAPVITAYPNAFHRAQQEIIYQPTDSEPHHSLHSTSTIRDVLLANQIIPQVLDDFEPTYYLDLSYPKHHERVLLGNDIPVKAVSKRPVFTFHPLTGPPSYGDPPSDKNLTFTLILTDPDALSRKHPVKSEMCHWIMTNLTSPLKTEFEIGWPQVQLDLDEFERFTTEDNDLDSDSVGKGLKSKPGEVEPYFPPAPPKKTGPHRYVFVLLEGDVSHLQPPKERPHWGYGKERHGIRDWSLENNLTVVGVNFFFAQHKKQ